MAHKELIKVYTERLNKLHKQNIEDQNTGLEYFVTNLQFLRDKLILTEDLLCDGQENIKIATLATAISEYKKYKDCINKYFIVSKNSIVPKETEDKEKLLADYNKEKLAHWKHFWAIIIENIEDWGITDATI